MFCPLPPWHPPLSFFLFKKKKKKYGGGRGLEEPRPGLCSLRDISPWGSSSRDSNHQTKPAPDQPGPPHRLLCTCSSGMDSVPESGGGGVPKSSMRPSTPAAQSKVGWKLGEDAFLPRGACHLDPCIGTGGRECGERRAGAFEKTGAALVALSPAPCRKELPGPIHGGGGRSVFYICVYIFF